LLIYTGTQWSEQPRPRTKFPTPSAVRAWAGPSSSGPYTQPTQTNNAPPGAPALAAHGFEVRSDLAFRLLRPTTALGRRLIVAEHDRGEPDVGPEPLLSWDARPDNPFARKIYELDGGFAVWHEGAGWFLVDPDRSSIAVPPHPEELRREERTLGLPTALCAIRGGDLVLHGSAVDVEGSAVLFCAPGHFGKTTLAGAFLQAGHRLLSDDMSCCRLEPEPSMLPGPAILRVRKDVFGRLEFPGTDCVAEDEHKAHLMLGSSARGSGSPIPIKAVVFLREASLRRLEGRSTIYRVPAPEALPNLWSVAFRLPNSAERTFQKVAALAGRVPVWEMYRPTSFDGLPDVVELVVSTCLPED
jgi:hypothetical protein